MGGLKILVTFCIFPSFKKMSIIFIISWEKSFCWNELIVREYVCGLAWVMFGVGEKILLWCLLHMSQLSSKHIPILEMTGLLPPVETSWNSMLKDGMCLIWGTRLLKHPESWSYGLGSSKRCFLRV